jgi:hypothetical protein
MSHEELMAHEARFLAAGYAPSRTSTGRAAS